MLARAQTLHLSEGGLVEDEPSNFTSKRLIASMLGAGLASSFYVAGINLSLADAVLFVILLGAVGRGKLYVPKLAAIFFAMLTVSLVIATMVVAPAVFGVEVGVGAFAVEYGKLLTLFGFYLVGIELSGQGILPWVYRSMYTVLAVLGGVGVAYAFFRVGLPDVFLFEGMRFSGSMTDPNNFAISCVVAIALVTYDNHANWWVKWICVTALIGGVLATGSKTGAIVLLMWVFISLAHGAMQKRHQPVLVAIVSVVGSLVIVILLSVQNAAKVLGVGLFAGNIPGLSRIVILFTGFDSALAGQGSDRDIAWNSALRIINRAPITGTGLGTYREVGYSLSGTGVLAHNTYLQMMAEWGVILAGLTLLFIAVLLMYSSPAGSNKGTIIAAKWAVVALLLASVGVSLNNSRTLWFLLGVLSFAVLEHSRCEESLQK